MTAMARGARDVAVTRVMARCATQEALGVGHGNGRTVEGDLGRRTQ
jgi:hypothetical protein